MTELDSVEVGRTSHELSVRHGAFALSYAQKMVERAEMAGDEKAVAFWRAVVAALRPRNSN
jgi:hypothetical protein